MKMVNTIVAIIFVIGISIMSFQLESDEQKAENTENIQENIQENETNVLIQESSELEVIEEKPDEVKEVPTEKIDSSYECWLAAEVIIAISMQFSDFEFTDIYLTGETKIEDYTKSEGVYVFLITEGEQIAMHSMPLTTERNESGTTDIYTEALGFATFDRIDRNSVDISGMKKVEIEELEEEISQSVLVSVYEH